MSRLLCFTIASILVLLILNISLGHNTEELLDIKARRHLHLVLWEQASRAYEEGEYREALSWYSYSLGLFPLEAGGSEGRDGNVAKLQV